MKVVLVQDVENLGKKLEVKKVADGYARNFLIPKGLAKEATKSAIEWVELQKEILARRAEEELKKIQEVASQLDDLELVIPVKIGEEGQLFQSIDAQDIGERLKQMGFEVKKSQVQLKEPIEELGEFPVKIRLEHNLEPEIRLIIIEEK